MSTATWATEERLDNWLLPNIIRQTNWLYCIKAFSSQISEDENFGGAPAIENTLLEKYILIISFIAVKFTYLNFQLVSIN